MFSVAYNLIKNWFDLIECLHGVGSLWCYSYATCYMLTSRSYMLTSPSSELVKSTCTSCSLLFYYLMRLAAHRAYLHCHRSEAALCCVVQSPGRPPRTSRRPEYLPPRSGSRGDPPSPVLEDPSATRSVWCATTARHTHAQPPLCHMFDCALNL